MTAPREIKKALVFKMMDDCAPGSTRREGTRRYVARYEGKVHHFPRGDRTLEVGHVKKIVTQLEIDRDCAKKHFPNVTFPPPTPPAARSAGEVTA